MKRLSQSKRMSMIESISRAGIMLVINWAMGVFILYPYYDLPVTPMMGTGIHAWFFVTSIISGFVWRRIFNYLHHRRIAKEVLYAPTSKP